MINGRRGKYTKRVTFVRRLKRITKRTLKWWKRQPLWRKITYIGSPIVVVALVIPTLTYLYYSRNIGDVDYLMNRNNTGVVLYDVHDKVVYSYGSAKHRDLVPLGKISTAMQHAAVASEDKDFYHHGGVSILSTTRALYSYLIHRGGSFGGSTITQQLAKITLLSHERSAFRQYQALSVSLAIENHYSKDQILDMYLNTVYFGENYFGIGDAAKGYFGTTPDKLNLAQSSLLVGLLPAPGIYSPISGSAELAKQRQEVVLNLMQQNGYITKDQHDAALNEKLHYKKTTASASTSIAPHYVETVLNQLYDKYGEENVLRSGYQVHTTLDLALQKRLNKIMQANVPNIHSLGGSDASAVAMDPRDGEVRALVGTLDYNNPKWGKINMATSPRQPASTFKTIYYAGALAAGKITPSTILQDAPINLDGWQPKNADRTWHGNVTVRTAINESLNIPSIHVMQKFGVQPSIDLARSLGVTDVKEDGDYGLTLAIGTAEVPLIQMTHAYTAFANRGVQYPITYIHSINDRFGKEIFKATENGERKISEAGAFLISNILSDNAARAPVFGSSLTVPGHTVAVKTGTTDDFKDALTIGYTPSLVLGVWVGNANNAPMTNEGYTLAGPIWQQTMIETLANTRDQPFVAPNTVVQRSTCYSNHGIATNNSTYNTYPEYYLASALPTATCAPVQPQPIEVCDLKAEKVVTIDQSKFDSKKYSKDTADCQPKGDGTDIVVCDLTTGQVTVIPQSKFDDSKYSKDTINCTMESPDNTQPPDNSGNGGPRGNR